MTKPLPPTSGVNVVTEAYVDSFSFALGDVWDWQPERPLDVLVCNAVLQWVPGHLELLPRWAGYLADGGWLAFQLPGNFDQPSHAIVRELAQSPRWRSLLADAELNRQAGDPADFASWSCAIASVSATSMLAR